MKYTLVVGIEYKKYKDPVNIRISAGERFIDEFVFKNDIKSFENADQVLYNIDKLHFNNLQYRQEDVTRGIPIDKYCQGPTDPRFVDNRWGSSVTPRYFRVYDIDSRHLKNKLKVTVNNSNSDYSNGFIKNSSLLRFPIIALLPKRFTDNKCENFIKVLRRFDSHDHERSKGIRFHDLYYYKRKKGYTDEIIESLDIEKFYPHTWPCPDFYKIKFFSKHSTSGFKLFDHWLGGSFEMELQIKKKHNVYFLCTEGISTIGMWSTGMITKTKNYVVGSLKQLINSYNENQ